MKLAIDNHLGFANKSSREKKDRKICKPPSMLNKEERLERLKTTLVSPDLKIESVSSQIYTIVKEPAEKSRNAAISVPYFSHNVS